MTLQFIHLLLSCILFSLPQSVSLFPLFGCNSLAREGISFWMHLFLSTLENNDGSCNYLFSCLLSSNDFYSFVACSIFVNFFCLSFSTRSLNFSSCIGFSHFICAFCSAVTVFSFRVLVQLLVESFVRMVWYLFVLIYTLLYDQNVQSHFVRRHANTHREREREKTAQLSELTVMHQFTSESDSVSEILNKLSNETLSLCDFLFAPHF